MKTYTYKQMRQFILQHLYYSMGANRMKWYEYSGLVVPSLKTEIDKIISEFAWEPSEYNSHDIDTIVRKIKEKYEIFGHYEGYSELNDSIQRYSLALG